VARKVEQGDFAGAEAYITSNLFGKPEDYFDLEKLRKSVQADRRITLREMIEKIFGFIPGFKSKEQLLDEECEKFLSIYKPPADTVLPAKNFLKAYVTDPEVRQIMESKEFGQFNVLPVGEDFRRLTPQMRKMITEYVKDYIPLNRYM